MIEPNKNSVIALVIGRYYWVKCFSDDEYEPTICVDKGGVTCFKFFNGVVIQSIMTYDNKELIYR